MSPLVRSLLALATFFVASDSKVYHLNEPPGSLCHGIKIVVDKQTSFEHRMQISFNYKSDEANELHEIEDHCKQLGLRIVDQTVRACNGFSSLSAPNWSPPQVHELGDMQLSPVFVSCRDNPECRPIEFHVNQTCMK